MTLPKFRFEGVSDTRIQTPIMSGKTVDHTPEFGPFAIILLLLLEIK